MGMSAVRVNNTIFVSGQLSHTPEGQLVAPAELGANGKPANFDTMEAQMRRTYENAQVLLAELGGSSRTWSRKRCSSSTFRQLSRPVARCDRSFTASLCRRLPAT